MEVDDLVTGWAGKGDYNSHDFTDLGKALQNYYGIDWYIWTNNLTDGVNSCYAYGVYLYSGYVYDYNRYSYSYYAVCR